MSARGPAGHHDSIGIAAERGQFCGQKVEAAIRNAKAFLEFREKEGSFDEFLWSFVGGAPKQNARRSLRQLPSRTRESDRMSEALVERGFRFVGPTICYAFMQAVGMVNDHLVTCFRHAQLRDSAQRG